MWSEYRCETDSQTSAFTRKLGLIENNAVNLSSAVSRFLFFCFLPFLENHTVSYLPVWEGENGQKIF